MSLVVGDLADWLSHIQWRYQMLVLLVNFVLVQRGSMLRYWAPNRIWSFYDAIGALILAMLRLGLITWNIDACWAETCL